MKTITYYKENKEFVTETELNAKTVHDVHGMKVRCIMTDGSKRIGYANTHYSMEKGDIVFEPLDYITLEIITGLDNLHKEVLLHKIFYSTLIAEVLHLEVFYLFLQKNTKNTW